MYSCASSQIRPPAVSSSQCCNFPLDLQKWLLAAKLHVVRIMTAMLRCGMYSAANNIFGCAYLWLQQCTDLTVTLK